MASPSSPPLCVYMGGEAVGSIDGDSTRGLRFTYDDGWVGDATPLSVSMPVAVRTHHHKAIRPYLWGLLPDNELVIARWAREAQCSASDILGLLRSVGPDVAGAAQYLPPDVAPDEVAEGAIEPLDERDVARLLAQVRQDTTAWHAGTAPGRWSLAGAQGKIALCFDADANRWGAPSGAVPTTHILKPAIAGLDDHDINEFLCLQTAQRLGLVAADSAVRRFGRERALVVRRYDRVTRDGVVVRVHQEDCCQALSVHPTRKYENEGGPSLPQIARLLRDVIPDVVRADADVDRLCATAGFNWLILGTDAHAKNSSLLLEGPEVRLAPLYDVASAAPYDDHPSKLRLAQKVDRYYRPTVLEARHWERFARACGADADRFLDRIRGMAADLPDAMSDVIRTSGLKGPERQAAIRLLDVLTPWVQACAARLDRR